MRAVFKILAAASLFALASAANAATTITVPVNTTYCASGCTQTGPNGFASFQASPNPYTGSGPVVATFGHTGIAAGTFQDLYTFTLAQSGTGSGSVTTSIDVSALFQGLTDTDFTSVLINGFAATPEYRNQAGVACFTPGTLTCGSVETFAITNVPIIALALNTITINGISRGLGSYGGQASFTPGVPEPATWAMMLIGFGATGVALRRRRRAPALKTA